MAVVLSHTLSCGSYWPVVLAGFPSGPCLSGHGLSPAFWDRGPRGTGLSGLSGLHAQLSDPSAHEVSVQVSVPCSDITLSASSPACSCGPGGTW